MNNGSAPGKRVRLQANARREGSGRTALLVFGCPGVLNLGSLASRLDFQIVFGATEDDFLNRTRHRSWRAEGHSRHAHWKYFPTRPARDGGQGVSALNNVELDILPRTAPFHLVVAQVQHFSFEFGLFVQMHGLLVGLCREGSSAK